MTMGCQEPGDLQDLRGTVKSYGRHVLALAGDTEFGPRVEHLEGKPVGQMAKDVKVLSATADLPQPPKFTALRTPSTSPEGLDLHVFPDRVTYRGVDADAWDRIKETHLIGGEVARDVEHEALTGTHILVCTHAARDERCGSCGPLLVEAFRARIAEAGYEDVHVHPSTHVGGHRYAGNVLVYPGGVWYGYVRPPNVTDVLEAHLEDDGVWEPHVRGRMEQVDA